MSIKQDISIAMGQAPSHTLNRFDLHHRAKAIYLNIKRCNYIGVF